MVRPRDPHADLVAHCRQWLSYPIETPTEARDGHFLLIPGPDVAPGVASYDGIHGSGSPDRAYSRAVKEADLQRALSGAGEVERVVGWYSRTHPRKWGFYAAAQRCLGAACGEAWTRWLRTPGWACHSPSCLLRGQRCSHSVDAAVYSAAEQMARILTVEWLSPRY